MSGASWPASRASASLADARRLAGPSLAAALRDSRAATLARTLDLDDDAWRVPQRPGVNPIAWELGHLAWFGEFWTLRGPHAADAAGQPIAARPARIAGPDAVFDSSRLGHAGRWTVELPTRAELVDRLQRQLDATLAALESIDPADDRALSLHRLALFHEDMHAEAFAWLRDALGLPAPAGLGTCATTAGDEAGVGDPRRPASIDVEAASIVLGRDADAPGFAFDNEMPSRRVSLDAFAIDARPVTNGAMLAFVEAGGYETASLWPGEAGAWRDRARAAHPERWRRGADGGWQARRYDRWRPLDPAAPLVHVNAWEAEAWCRWAGRRLPSAAERERAASRPGFAWGTSVWEWTADPFAPHPGFVAGPYADYSRPWFGDHRELRGGAAATPPRLLDPGFRNFFRPERRDVFAGFRSAASRR